MKITLFSKIKGSRQDGAIYNGYLFSFDHLGVCCHCGKIYSLEGFGESQEHPPAIRVIDALNKKEISFEKFEDSGINTEPEMIDFENDICYYSDHHGNMYKLEF